MILKRFIVLIALWSMLSLQGCTSSTLATVQPLPEQTKQQVQEKLVISLVGDIMVHDTELAAAYRPASQSYDFSPFFSLISPILQAADLTIGNLETTLGDPAGGYSGYPCFKSPPVLAANLKAAGFDILTTANNHSLDRGEAGLVQTIRKLDEAGVLHTGTFLSKENQKQPLMTQAKGQKIAVLAYTYGMNGFTLPKSSTAAINTLDPRQIKQDISTAKEQGAKIVLVCLHFGEEYRPKPAAAQTQLAQDILQAGADVIVGHHPHVLQPVIYSQEILDSGSKAKLIAYSLGNFLSDQRGVERKSSAILNLYWSVDPISQEVRLDKATFLPIWTHRYRDQGRPAFRIVPVESALVSIRTGYNDFFTPSDVKDLESAWNHVRNSLSSSDPRLSLQQLTLPLQGLSDLTDLEDL